MRCFLGFHDWHVLDRYRVRVDWTSCLVATVLKKCERCGKTVIDYRARTTDEEVERWISARAPETEAR